MIYTLTGDNSFAIDDKLKEIENKFVTSYSDFSVESIDCAETSFEQIIDSISNTSLFDTEKLVILRDPDKNTTLSQEVDKVINKGKSTNIILVCGDIDKRSKLFKSLKKDTNFYEFKNQRQNFVEWVKKQVEKLGGEISASDINYVIEVVGTDQTRIYNELQKLIDYNPKITKKSIDLLCERTPQSSVFELLDSVFLGNYKKACEIYNEQRNQRVEPLAILGMIIWQLHVFLTVSFSNDLSAEDIASKARLNPFVIKKAQSSVRRISRGSLKDMIKRAADLDASLKKDSINPDTAIKNFIFYLATS